MINYSYMKYISSLFIAFSLVLSACGGSSSDQDTVNNQITDDPLYHDYVTNDFSISIPDDWETVNSFDSTFPDNLRVAFKNNIKDKDFIANVTIIEESADDSLTNKDVSQNKLKKNSDTLLSYKLISQEELDLNDNSTYLNTFEGKNYPDGETYNFMQTYLAKGDTYFVVTATYLPIEDEFVVSRMEKMLKSFILK